MNENITLNHLILYLYNETALSDSVLVQKAIDHDEEVAEEFQSLIEARDLISKSLLAPSGNSIQSILSYSRLTAPLQVA